MAKAKSRPQSNTVRIIGGEYRGRKLSFPDVEGLRPTTDRVRETVFNWLQQEIVGARCLDLFCGSGALGLESLSRGAKSVQFVDQDKKVCQQIDQNLAVLKSENGTTFCGTAEQFLRQTDVTYDVIFLDPPFQKNLMQKICDKLENSSCLSPRATIYLEAEFPLEEIELPTTWKMIRSKKAGAVFYGLVERIVN